MTRASSREDSPEGIEAERSRAAGIRFGRVTIPSMPFDLDAGICRVRSLRESDLHPLVESANDRRIWLQVRDRFPHPYTAAEGTAFLSHTVGIEPELTFAIEVDGAMRGAIGIVPGSDVERVSGEVGYWLAPAYWGRGIATAALSAFVPRAFATFALERIFALPFAHNAASRRVLEKSAFVLEAVLRRSAIKDGRVLDQALYARWREPAADGGRED